MHMADAFLLVFGVTAIALGLLASADLLRDDFVPSNLDNQLSSEASSEIVMPSVSVIMNVRNGAVNFREALASVLVQTFQDWELIAWDDCSTDASAQIVGEYKDPRIRYFLLAGGNIAG